jgi:hypothetical protein
MAEYTPTLPGHSTLQADEVREVSLKELQSKYRDRILALYQNKENTFKDIIRKLEEDDKIKVR